MAPASGRVVRNSRVLAGQFSFFKVTLNKSGSGCVDGNGVSAVQKESEG